MAKKLVIWWKHYEMSAHVAGKAMSEGAKTYTVVPMATEFPIDKDAFEAMKEIYDEFGIRPEVNPFRGKLTPHAFAEIVGWKHIDISEPEPPRPVEQHEERKLL